MLKNAITTQIKFTDENKFYMITDNNNRLIIFYKLKDNYFNELTAEAFLKALIEIKEFCIDKQITQFSTIRLEGVTTLTSFENIRTMFRYVFKETDIGISIYTEQSWTAEEREKLIYE